MMYHQLILSKGADKKTQLTDEISELIAQIYKDTYCDCCSLVETSILYTEKGALLIKALKAA